MKKSEAVKTRKSATRRKRPVKDLEPRKAPTGGATTGHVGGINVALGDGSVRFLQ